MRLFVGLGNPGAKYQNNRHNIGFMAVDEIVRRHNFSGWSKKFQGELSEGNFEGQRVLLLKPLTFMNLSGQSVQAAAAFYKITLDDIIVLHDELDLTPSKVRVKKGGGSGGHNGIKSIDGHLGQDYWRVRLGIGHPGNKDMVSPYVLSDFYKEEQPWLNDLMDATARNFGLLVKGDTELFMTKVAHAVPPLKEDKVKEDKENKDTKEKKEK